jgi:hypothetical protein
MAESPKIQGSKNRSSKLTEAQVEFARRMVALRAAIPNCEALGRMLGVSDVRISHITTRENEWNHVRRWTARELELELREKFAEDFAKVGL